jgi:hypothetical protein
VSSFTVVPLEGDVKAVLGRLPTSAGVGQILGPEGRNLVIGRPANLRKWASGHLGLGPPPAKGKRPPTDLRPIATAVAFAAATSGFHQRVLFERLMDLHVPRAKRRDLKPPAFLVLDAAARFPRIESRGSDGDLRHAFGPFRDRRSAERAREALQKEHGLRPCDYTFEPDPALPLGLGCLFAQVRSCAAPCLQRIGEDDYRALAARAAAQRAGRGPRPDELARLLPPFVAEAGTRGLVVASKREGVELYPVAGGAVCEEDRVELGNTADAGALAAACGQLRFAPAAPRDDRPWLLSWLLAPRRGGSYLVVGADEAADALAARVREVLT